MQSPNLNFSIVNAVLFARRIICCFQAKPHIFLQHGLDTQFPQADLIRMAFPRNYRNRENSLDSLGGTKYGEYRPQILRRMQNNDWDC